MSFSIGAMISGAVQGFMETGNPYAAAGIGAVSGFEGQNAGQSGMLGQDSVLAGSSDASSSMDLSQFADAFSGG